jgi:hypothetical protein
VIVMVVLPLLKVAVLEPLLLIVNVMEPEEARVTL